MSAEAETEFSQIPGSEKALVKAKRLGGLTNRVFEIEAGGARCKRLIDSPELRIHLDAVRAG